MARHASPFAGAAFVVRFAILAVILLAGALVLPNPASAQTPTFPFPITKFNCDEDPGVIGQAEVPEGCEPVEGVSMTVYDGEDNVLGTCITGEGGTCIVDLEVPDDAMVYVEEDVSTATPGYTPLENPVAVEIVMEFSEGKLVNLPDAPDLPNTGSGPVSSGVSTSVLAAAMAATAALLWIGGTVTRRYEQTVTSRSWYR